MFAPARRDRGLLREECGEILVADLRRRQQEHQDGETEGGDFRPLRPVTRRYHYSLSRNITQRVTQELMLSTQCLQLTHRRSPMTYVWGINLENALIARVRNHVENFHNVMICSETKTREQFSRYIALACKRPATAGHLHAHRAQARGTKARADRLLDPQFLLSVALARETFTFC